MCRDSVRNAKAHLELNLARDLKSNKKGFLRVYQQHREDQGKHGPHAKWGRGPDDKWYGKEQVILETISKHNKNKKVTGVVGMDL